MAKRPTSPENQVRRAVKKLEYEIDSLEEALIENGGNFDGRVRLRGSPGTIRVIVRIRRPDKHYKWAMSVLLNNQRIDGIDWEPLIHDHRGKSHDCKGWHRHIWSPASADKLKECLPKFNPSNVRDFILGGFKILKVQLRREGTRNGIQLRFG